MNTSSPSYYYGLAAGGSRLHRCETKNTMSEPASKTRNCLGNLLYLIGISPQNVHLCCFISSDLANPFCNIPNVMDHVVNVGEVLQDDPSDPCHYLACYAQQVLAEVTVPGCIDGPVEPDYGVTQLLVNGGWTAWEDVSECSGTCPSGTVIQRRNCTNPPPSNEGNYCLGSSTRNASCEPKQCRVDELCGYGAWSNWSSCSVTCGTGVQTRNRTADVQPAAIVPCSHLEEARTCKMATCVTSGNCRLRKTLQLLPGEGADSNCITPEPQRVARECRGTCQGGSSCVPTFQTHSYNMSCPDGFRAVPARIVVLCSCQ